MKEDKKENGNGDANAVETDGEHTDKKPRLDTEEVAEQNGTEAMDGVAEDDEAQEVKDDVPVVEATDEKIKVETEEPQITEPEPVKESPSPVAKTTPTRGRGGRGRGTARRGRSSR